MSRGTLRAAPGDAFAGATGRLAGLPHGNAGWSGLHCRALAIPRILPHPDSGGCAGLPQDAFLLESPGSSGNSAARQPAVSYNRVTIPETRPITSTSSG